MTIDNGRACGARKVSPIGRCSAVFGYECVGWSLKTKVHMFGLTIGSRKVVTREREKYAGNPM